MEPRSEIAEHALRMEFVLQDNDDKSHWSGMSLHSLDEHLRKHTARMTDAVCKNDLNAIVRIATHISNYAMMLSDNSKKKKDARN